MSLLRDLRYAGRRLRRTPAFTALVVATLALGIGANTAIFSVVDAVLLRPLPYRDVDRLVAVRHSYPSQELLAPVDAAGFARYRDEARSFGGLTAVRARWEPNLTGQGEPERLVGARVSGRFFEVLGVPAALGRTLLPDEDAPGRHQAVVLGDGLWRRLGADRGIVGRTILLDGEPHEVVGVMPPGFRDPGLRDTELWRPLALPPEEFAGGRGQEWLDLVARLRPGVGIEAARAELAAVARRARADEPGAWPPDWTIAATPLVEQTTGAIRPAVLVLLGAVGFVLLIACANVANLLLARGAGRGREVAVRVALGARRADLVRQLLAESVLLALAGGVFGVALAWAGVRALGTLAAASLPGGTPGIDARILGFALLLSLVVGIAFGLVPALQTSRVDLQEALKEGARGAVGARATHAIRRGLVVGEVALALVLLTGAGLLLKSFARLQAIDPGFDTGRLLTFTIALPASRYETEAQRVAFFDRVLGDVAALPGVRAAGAVSILPFGPGGSTNSYRVEGRPFVRGQPGPWGDFRHATPGYFRTLGIPLVKGRLLDERDRAGAPLVAVVDEETVRRWFPREEPVGRRIAFDVDSAGNPVWVEIVGVVGHVKTDGLLGEDRIQLYLPWAQTARPTLQVAVRAAGDPLALVPAVRAVVRRVDADQPLSRVSTMESMVGDSVGQRRLAATLLAGFAALAMLMACIGIYGVMSQLVAERTREIGVRVALGARRADVLRLVVGQGMTLALAGVALGLLGAFALTRLIRSQLYAVEPTDPATYVLVAALLAAVALAATLVPALRASRVDPAVALRAE